jgi:hypothetical protein
MEMSRQRAAKVLGGISFTHRGHEYAEKWHAGGEEKIVPPGTNSQMSSEAGTLLKKYFESHTEGKGIWKYLHYFDIYERHFSKFVGREVNVLEIGVYSGGSLEMWRDYFGANCRVYGVDIKAECKAYEDDRTKVFIGDQADRSFWKKLREEVPHIDIVIDDGGHEPEQQIVTLEEILPYLRSGGVYLCEDVEGDFHPFSSYIHGLSSYLNSYLCVSRDKNGGAVCPANKFQSAIHSIHLYPFVVVIEINDKLENQFSCQKHGTEWQSFL